MITSFCHDHISYVAIPKRGQKNRSERNWSEFWSVSNKLNCWFVGRKWREKNLQSLEKE